MANLRSSSTKKGRGNVKKSLAGSASASAMRSGGAKHAPLENNHFLRRSSVNGANETDYLTVSEGISTRSGRTRNQSKDNMKIMETIIKIELVPEENIPKSVKDSPTSNGNNNNDLELCDQNNTILVNKNIEESPKRQSRRNGKTDDSATNLIGKIRVARNIFKDSPTNTTRKQDVNLNSNRINSNISITNGTNSAEKLRQNVINQMKSVLSTPDELPEKEPKKIAKKRKNKSSVHSNPKENVPSEKSKKRKVDPAPIDKSKMKHVTLSNGLVLTLSLVQCDHCQKSFSNKASLSRHMLSHFDLRPYHCSECPRKFRYRSTLKIHTERRHPPTDNMVQFHVCHICDKTFQMEENLELHLASHVKTENSFKCIYCDKTFSYRLLLIQHEKTHLDTGRFKCYLCEMTYDTRSRLSNHLKSHNKVKEYICQYCGKEFQRLNSIKRHVKVCHGGHRIQCPICNKDLKGHLTEHMRVHDQDRPHICPECGQRFTQSTQLKVHRRSHTGIRPYACRICNRPFGHSNALMLHIRRHTGEKPFTCAMCPMSFSQLPHMKAHMRKIHNKDCAYKCKKCGQFFKLKIDLDMHAKDCTVGDKQLSFEEQIQASVQVEEIEVESVMSLSKMRFLLALLLTMIASKEKLKYLGFNKRLVDDLLEESLEAMGYIPCKEDSLTPLKRLKRNIEILLDGTIPKDQMEKFKSENRTTEELLILLTDEKKNGEMSLSEAGTSPVNNTVFIKCQ